MTQIRTIRSDEHGLYVLTGGYAFRPVGVARQHFSRSDLTLRERTKGLPDEPSSLRRGQRVKAGHIGGTTLASVDGETWVSSGVDPRYIEYSRR